MIALAAPVWRVCDFCLIFVPFGHYDEPEILPYEIPLICSIGADVRHKGRKIIVSVDKDMRTVPSNVYRTSHPDEGVVQVTEAEADYYHLFQTLVGDATDGYPGCPGIGPVRATKILSNAVFQNAETGRKGGPTDFWGAIVAAYDKAGFGEEEALVQARCARILRSSDYDFQNKEPILWNP